MNKKEVLPYTQKMIDENNGDICPRCGSEDDTEQSDMTWSREFRYCNICEKGYVVQFEMQIRSVD